VIGLIELIECLSRVESTHPECSAS